MSLRILLPLLAFACACFAESSTAPTVRGKLTQRDGKPPALATAQGKLIVLDGDPDTLGVLKDKRLAGADVELRGRFTGPDAFKVDEIHHRSMHVHKDGKKLLVSYWCDVCSIRTYTPGICWCCQEDTALQLRESEAGKDPE